MLCFSFHNDAQSNQGIHRALFWLEINGDGTYPIPELSSRHMTAQELNAATSAWTGCALPVHAFPASFSGFITRGDNNQGADQCLPAQGFGYDPARLDYVLGKARGELPWIGLVKLFVDDVTAHSNNFGNAGSDSKVMLLVTVVVLIGAPWSLDVYMRRRHRKRLAAQEEKGDAKDDAKVSDDATGEAESKPTESRRKGKGDS